MSAVKDYFINTLKYRYADFSGRASRSEYWYFMLYSIVIFLIVLGIVMSAMDHASDISNSGIGSKILVGLLVILAIAWTIPSVAVSIRRLHDTGRSGWWYLLRLVGLGIVIFIFSVLESEPGRNKWGPNPWESDEGEDDISQHLIEDNDEL